MTPRRASAASIALIKQFESCRLDAYDDGTGRWTIGWGHTAGVSPGQRCTQEQADHWLAHDIKIAEQGVIGHVDPDISQSMFDALVSFVFNFGADKFSRSTMLRRMNERDWIAASEEFQRWNKMTVGGKLVPQRGLARRRHWEAALFLEDRFPA